MKQNSYQYPVVCPHPFYGDRVCCLLQDKLHGLGVAFGCYGDRNIPKHGTKVWEREREHRETQRKKMESASDRAGNKSWTEANYQPKPPNDGQPLGPQKFCPSRITYLCMCNSTPTPSAGSMLASRSREIWGEIS